MVKEMRSDLNPFSLLKHNNVIIKFAASVLLVGLAFRLLISDSFRFYSVVETSVPANEETKPESLMASMPAEEPASNDFEANKSRTSQSGKVLIKTRNWFCCKKVLIKTRMWVFLDAKTGFSVQSLFCDSMRTSLSLVSFSFSEYLKIESILFFCYCFSITSIYSIFLSHPVFSSEPINADKSFTTWFSHHHHYYYYYYYFT